MPINDTFEIHDGCSLELHNAEGFIKAAQIQSFYEDAYLFSLVLPSVWVDNDLTHAINKRIPWCATVYKNGTIEETVMLEATIHRQVTMSSTLKSLMDDFILSYINREARI